MSGPRVGDRTDIDPDEYRTAAQKMAGVNAGVDALLSTLSANLAPTGGMAGNDTIGISFGTDYDAAAAGLFTVGNQYVMATGNVARALHAALDNHLDANASSDIGKTPIPPRYDFTVTTTNPPAPPSSIGDTGGLPGIVEKIREHIAIAWPNANPAELRNAATAWRAAADLMPVYAQDCVDAKGRLSALEGAELTIATASCTALATVGTKLGAAMGKLADACDAYATKVEAQHQEIVRELEKFMAQAAVVEFVGVLGTEVGGELWANLYEGGRAARLVARIAEIVTELASQVDIDTARAREVRHLVKDLERDIARYAVAGQTVSFKGTKASWRDVWNMRDDTRGQVIEDFLGQNLPQNFKTWDRWDPKTGEAVSIKSININTDGYQTRPPSNMISVHSKVMSFAQAAHDYTRYSMKDPTTGAERTVIPDDIRHKVVELVIPGDAIPSQEEKLDEAIADAGRAYPDVVFKKVKL